MSIALYMDHHVPRAVTVGLRQRDIDVLTAYEDDAHELEDWTLLDRATALARVLFTQDVDLQREASSRQENGIYFAGVIYGHQRLSIGTVIRDLEFFAKAGDIQDFENRLHYLPL